MELNPEQNENQKPWWPPGSKCQCKKNVKYMQPERVKSYAPNQKYKVPEAAVSGDTMYNMSYKDFNTKDLAKCKGAPIHPKDNLVSAGDFQSDTTNKMSFGPWEGYTRSPKFGPRDHCLLGVGPIQDMTTTKHDYTPKIIDRPPKIKPPGCLGMSAKAMEQNTTNALSYGWPDNYEPASSYKPEKRYLPPSTKMAQDTTQKMSFRPWDPRKKEMFPWAEKAKYAEPSIPMSGETMYNNSYYAPGKFIEDPACGECYCLHVGECFNEEGNPPKAHEYNVCPSGYDPQRDGPREYPT